MLYFVVECSYMNHTPQIKKAIQFAARKHHGHLRVSSTPEEPLPYVTHLFSVALLVAEDGAPDDVVTAALLHDTLEDTRTTREEIVTAFNERVAHLVESVTEIKEEAGERLEWRAIKLNYLALIEKADTDALLIAIADKIDNIESRVDEYKVGGEAFLARWKHPNADHLWFFGEALQVAQARLPEHRLTKRFAEAHARQLALLGDK